jgi:hypothetical protein
MTEQLPSQAQWHLKARAVAHYADLFWQSSRQSRKHLEDLSAPTAGTAELGWVKEHWPEHNKFEQSMFVSIAAMLADDVFEKTDPVAQANERFPLVLHIHVTAMSDDDLIDWAADDLERMLALPGDAERTDLERQFIARCEALLSEMLIYITAQ